MTGTRVLDSIETTLQRLGYQAFRPGQREALETLLDAGRLLLVAPTGGGKSLIYQLPAAILPGTTLVVSPLISLMHDQVQALEERGLPATYLASTLEAREVRRRMAEAASGRYKLVYVAPERIMGSGFRGMLRALDCPLVAIDEAHCISEWGHDFRPEYLQLGQLLRDLPGARVLACTATATPIVRDEILERLGLPADTPQILRGFSRPNLVLRVAEVQTSAERTRHVDALLKEALGTPGRARGTAIVYATTRKKTRDEAKRLAGRGWLAAAYNAGMDGDAREAVQGAFAAGKTEVVVATNAFGMGIDRPDVRAVIHLGPPGSIEAYYQEVGRAGRDGEIAYCLLMVSAADMAVRRHLIESDAKESGTDPAMVQHKWTLFLELMRWAEGGSCRHDAILRYFGDEAETLAGCGHCDVCRGLREGGRENPEAVSVIVRKALCGVARVHGRYGIKAAVKLLKGAEDERLLRMGLEQSPTFGALRDRSEEWLMRLLRRCVTAGWVDFRGGDRPVVVVTEEGEDVIHARRPARLLLPLEVVRVSGGKRRGERRRDGGGRVGAGAGAGAGAGGRVGGRKGEIRGDEGDVFDARAQALFEALRRYRLDRARAEGVPPFVIASDRTLRDIASLRPGTLEELLQAHGIGPAKVKRYGVELLGVVQGGLGNKAV